MSASSSASPRVVVLKVGTSSLLRADGKVLALSCMTMLVETVAALREAGCHVVLVSSGAVGVGCQRMGLEEPPAEIGKRQALAAVGQIHLMYMYDQFFSALGQRCAQVLLSYENLGVKSQYENARRTFQELLRMGVVPIVNENDTVAVEELRFGDNDRLAAMVAGIVDASLLYLLTDVDGLYTGNPRTDPNATKIEEVADVQAILEEMSTTARAGGSSWGTGGMYTKLVAAGLASAAGVRTIIMDSGDVAAIPGSLLEGGKAVGTSFLPVEAATTATRKRWIIGLKANGELCLDEGATKAVRRKHSLYSVGVTKVREGGRVLEEKEEEGGGEEESSGVGCGGVKRRQREKQEQ